MRQALENANTAPYVINLLRRGDQHIIFNIFEGTSPMEIKISRVESLRFHSLYTKQHQLYIKESRVGLCVYT